MSDADSSTLSHKVGTTAAKALSQAASGGMMHTESDPSEDVPIHKHIVAEMNLQSTDDSLPEDARQIKQNLIIISLVCNAFSLFVCIFIIVQLLRSISNSKDNRSRRKVKLYKLSVVFVFSIMILVVLLMITPLFNSIFWISDIAMDVTLWFSLLFWWTQWKESVNLYITNRFMQMLKSDEPRNRLTFMARISNLGSK
jgi:hypothetical protein